MSGAVAAWLPGGRLHLQHGPIDLIVKAEGPGAQDGYGGAAKRFGNVLDELVCELSELRRCNVGIASVRGSVARRMVRAVAPFAPDFITPMAAVAGAVADEVLAALTAGPGIDRAWVNNGGDIAVHLAGAARFDVALAGADARVSLRAHGGIGGVATSGWRGRSQSLGIADAVTVLARDAAAADAAATMIANAVDLPGHPGITRRPATEIKADSDLGARLVTVDVARLSAPDRAAALGRGLACAETCRARGMIAAAHLMLQGDRRIAGPILETLDA